jgi:hypothetical protein
MNTNQGKLVSIESKIRELKDLAIDYPAIKGIFEREIEKLEKHADIYREMIERTKSV